MWCDGASWDEWTTPARLALPPHRGRRPRSPGLRVENTRILSNFRKAFATFPDTVFIAWTPLIPPSRGCPPGADRLEWTLSKERRTPDGRDRVTTSHTATSTVVVDDLQATLVELIDLTLLAKQAHWNVVGQHFRSVHLELDEIVDTGRLAADQVAERIATIGSHPDGRAVTIAATSKLPAFAAGRVTAAEVVEAVGATIDEITGRIRGRIGRLADPDPISQDIIIGIGDQLEKHAWMLRAQQG